jgi:hypothetical protein
VIRPTSNSQGVLQHLDALVTFMFWGDASRIVFGMCNDDDDQFYCGGTAYAVDSVDGASIMKSLSNMYPCHGGAFFWSASSDPSDFWSTPLLATLKVDACVSDVEQSLNEDKDKNKKCVNPVTAHSCSDCVKNGRSWCMVNDKSICQPNRAMVRHVLKCVFQTNQKKI